MVSLRRPLSALVAIGLVVGSISLAAAPAYAEPTDGASAKGRATGSGQWGYVGQFGERNASTQATAGQFVLPYGIDVRGDTIAVTDSGLASDESGSKVIGHTTQTFVLDASPGSAGHGDYLGSGMYDVRTDKRDLVDPAKIVTATGLVYHPEGGVRGPRGVVLAADGTVVESLHDDAISPSTINGPHLFRYADTSLSIVKHSWGSGARGTPGVQTNAIGLDTDASGNVYSASESAGQVNVFAPDGTFLSSVGFYFDDQGRDWSQTITWANRRTTIPLYANDPHRIEIPHAVSVLEEEEGRLIVYVGDGSSAYAPDLSVHFPDGVGVPAQHVKPASIKRYIVEKSGGTVSATRNPAGWKWTLDTSFGTDGQIVVGTQTPTAYMVGASPRYSAGVVQVTFAAHADGDGNRLYYATGRPGTTVPVIGTVDLTTGASLAGPARVNSPGTQNDSAMGFVRGLATDDRGLVYATSQASTFGSNARGVVQIFGMTPSPVPEATIDADMTSAQVTWTESAVGHAQPDLLDYVVRYRQEGASTWTTVLDDGAVTSTRTARTLTGLLPGTAYDVCVTPWNEAGSGDPACEAFRTDAGVPALALVKLGDGVSAPDQDRARPLEAGATVAFSYRVTNTGTATATNVLVTDDLIATVAAPDGFDGSLDPGEEVTFTATGPVAAGAYVNTATVAADGIDPVQAQWHGFGVTRGLAITKTGAGVTAASEAEAVTVLAGSSVAFEYAVTNLGNTAVGDVAVTDDQVATIEPPEGFTGVLAAGETVVFTARGEVPQGEYVNTATVSATGVDPASTRWHGIGAAAQITLIKKGDGRIARDSESAVELAGPTDISFTYEVTNSGVIAVTDVVVTDDTIAVVRPPEGFSGSLAPGESAIFTAVGPVSGTYRNTATVTTAEGATAEDVWNAVARPIDPSPSVSPSASPSVTPSASPSVTPSVSPSASPSATPSVSPAASPSVAPTTSPSPTVQPSRTPTVTPTVVPADSPSPGSSAAFPGSSAPTEASAHANLPATGGGGASLALSVAVVTLLLGAAAVAIARRRAMS